MCGVCVCVACVYIIYIYIYIYVRIGYVSVGRCCPPLVSLSGVKLVSILILNLCFLLPTSVCVL